LVKSISLGLIYQSLNKVEFRSLVDELVSLGLSDFIMETLMQYLGLIVALPVYGILRYICQKGVAFFAK
jgi:hypothetical protein